MQLEMKIVWEQEAGSVMNKSKEAREREGESRKESRCVSVHVCVQACVHARQIWIIMFQRAQGESLCAEQLQVIKYPVL